MSRRAALKGLAALFLATAVFRAWCFVRPPIYDEGIYAYGGREWFCDGRPLYEATTGTKPPAIFVAYGVGMLLERHGFTAVKVLGLIVVALTAWLLMLLGAELHSSRAGLLAGLAYAFIASEGRGVDPPFLSSEVLLAAFVTGAVLAVIKARGAWGYLLAGALAALAAQCKQTAVLDVAGVVLISALAFRTPPVRGRLAFVLLGGAVVTAGVVGCFAARGQLGNYIELGWLVQFSAGYGAGEINRLAGLHHLALFLLVDALFVALAVVAATAVFREMPQPNRRAMWIWLAAAVLSPLASGPRYPHHLISALPPLCVFAGIGLDWLLTAAPAWPRRLRLAVAAALLFLALPAAQNAVDATRCLVGPLMRGLPNCEEQCLGRYIAATTSPSDKIMAVAGSTRATSTVYIFADRDAPTRFISDAFLSRGRALAEVSAAFETRAPKWLIFNQRPGAAGEAGDPGRNGGSPALRYILTFLLTHPYQRVQPPGTRVYWAYELQPEKPSR